MKISIIGAGNMGSAIALGLRGNSQINGLEICCADLIPEKLRKMKEMNASIEVTTDNLLAVNGADIVIIAVKPWLVETIINEVKEALDYEHLILVSIAAGIDFFQLSRYLQKEDGKLPAIFRIVPNTAITVKESVNFIANCNATQTQFDLIHQMFSDLGYTIHIEEQLIPACTALSSCGIAFAFRYIRAAVAGAVELGIHHELAQKIETQTLRGAITLLESNNSHPEAEIDKVTTPGGITIKGLNAMEEAGFTNAVIKGLKSSV